MRTGEQSLVGIWRALRVGHHLHQPETVAQVDEGDPTVVTTPVYPACQGDRLPGMLPTQLATSVGFIHNGSSKRT